jgi:NADPH:quinone reductase-like Zn-dependent oxidoreductase
MPKSARTALSLLLTLLLTLMAAPALRAAEVPATMQAATAYAYGAPDTVRIATVATPKPAAGEVLVRVMASSVNPIDWKQLDGSTRDWWPLEFPARLGRDVAGVIAAIGPDVADFEVGDEVMAYLGRATGSFAEYCVVPAAALAARPENMSFTEAAGVPLVGLTAWQALLDTGGLGAAQRVLIHGGAGGVGSAAVQIAKARGAHVIATASARNHEFLRRIGADETIDYRSARFEDVVANVDLVLDTVGGDTLLRSVDVVRPGGTLVTIAGRVPDSRCEARGIRCAAILVESRGDQLDELRRLIESGRYRVHVDGVFQLDEVAAALALNADGHTRGKIVIEIDSR